ncbi:TolC family protein [Novosphingobium sp. 9]|uniref:TolC family protein n=1 Tax=Novosphingobium sp. 9 TaxID=2025349 RepID=UPI0021B4EAA1|nr:TolC family protein [Novosphingobium sp. 9]
MQPTSAPETRAHQLSDGIVVIGHRPERTPWWKDAGDPILAALIDQGLYNASELGCGAQAVRAFEKSQQDREGHIGNRLAKLVGEKPTQADPLLLSARAYRWLDTRGHYAERIALAYFEVRRLQRREALRSALADQFKDNGEIARFRREAGLVPAIDGSLADSQDEVNRSELGLNQGRLDRAVADLATLTDLTPEEILKRLGTAPDTAASAPDPMAANANVAGDRPDLLALRSAGIADQLHGKVVQSDIEASFAATSDPAAPALPADAPAGLLRYRQALDTARATIQNERATLAKAELDEAGLQTALAKAQRTVDDARLAYRNGMGDFSALYVAEAAALAVREGQIDAEAARLSAMARLWTDRGATWSRNDLNLLDNALPEGAPACD